MFLHRSHHAASGSAPLWSALMFVLLMSALVARASAAGPDVKGKTISVAEIASPGHFKCVGKNHFSGAVSVPIEKSGVTTDHAYAMHYIDPVQGHSIIVYGDRYQQSPPLYQAFIRRHECQHANRVRDEIMANCGALTQMRGLGLTLAQEKQIAEWHAAEGTLDPRYGGTGARFWQLTLECAGER